MHSPVSLLDMHGVFLRRTRYTVAMQPTRMMPQGATFEAFVIGQQIRHIRRSKDVSQVTLAKQTGVSVGWIGRIERGLDMPNLTLLVKIARALQVRVRDLVAVLGSP
jgi:DNA-binding XRE family transcriptional regulator